MQAASTDSTLTNPQRTEPTQPRMLVGRTVQSQNGMGVLKRKLINLSLADKDLSSSSFGKIRIFNNAIKSGKFSTLNATSLELHACTDFTGADFAKLPKKLIYLAVTDTPTWSCHDLQQLVACQTALMSLNLSGCRGLDLDADRSPNQARMGIGAIGSLTTLTQLSLREANVNDLALEMLARSASSLRSIDLRGCKRVSEVGLRHLVYGCLKLERVFIDPTPRIHESLPTILSTYEPEQKTLKLNLSETFCETTHQIIFKRYPKLCFLLLERCQELTNLDTLFSAMGTATRARLLALHLKDFGRDDVQLLRKVRTYLPTLPKLLLQGALTAQGVHEIGRLFSGLVKIVMKPNDGMAIGDSTLLSLVQACSNLSELVLCNFARLTPSGLRQMLQASHSLQKLTLSDCRGITVASAIELQKEFQNVTFEYRSTFSQPSKLPFKA